MLLIKRFFLLSFLLLFGSLFPQEAHAQLISFGYRSHFGGMEAYKDVVNFYNDNRPWLTKEFSSSGYMHGFEIGFGGAREEFGFSLFNISAQFAKTRAKGSVNNIAFTRIIRTRMYAFEIADVWYTPLHVKNINIGAGLMPFGLGRFRIRTYMKDEKAENAPLDNLEASGLTLLVKSFHYYACPHFDVTYVNDNDHSFHFQLFYTFGSKHDYDLFYINNTLNPSTSAVFRQRSLLKINNYGLKLIYSF